MHLTSIISPAEGKQAMNQHDAPPRAARPNSKQLFTETISVAEAVARTLEEGGVELALGICAGFTTPFFEALYAKTKIRTIQVRQEILGSLAANAFGRLTGKPVVISGEGEFMLGTATQGIIESLLGSTPMVIITEMFDGGRMAHHGNYHSGSGEQGSYDAVAGFKAICKRVFVAHHPAQAVQQTQLALKHAVTGEPGPVCVILHSTCLEGTVGPDSFPRLYPTAGYLKPPSRAVDLHAVRAAADAIERAERPVIVAGHGVRLAQAYEELKAFAYAAGAPVVTTQGGKGVFDELDPLGGGTFGEWGRESANAIVGDADLIVAVGTKLGPPRYRRPDSQSDRSHPADARADRHRAAERRVDLPCRPHHHRRRRPYPCGSGRYLQRHGSEAPGRRSQAPEGRAGKVRPAEGDPRPRTSSRCAPSASSASFSRNGRRTASS
jgi:thiamine pyrophosphate-dependent acetolactate synthase large subunit-like protein